MRRYILPLATAALLLPSAASAELPADSTSFSYMPTLALTLRPRAEWSTSTGDGRFEVRNSDLTLSGYVMPQIDYCLRADYCLEGKFMVLDAWARLKAGKEFAVQAGQFRMPFGVESFRAPHNYYFANRSFMGKQMCNFRGVGAKGTWSSSKLPLSAEFGVFNPTTIADHSIWVRTVAFGGKAAWKIDDFTITAGALSIRPNDVRINFLDGNVTWTTDRWLVAAEYMYEHYTNKAHKPSHSYVAFANYAMPVKIGYFNRLSLQGRFDGMTAHSNGYRDAEGGRLLPTDHPSRNRATVGATLSYVHKSGRFVDIRLNYEQYFYKKGVQHSITDSNKAVAEIVLHI